MTTTSEKITYAQRLAQAEELIDDLRATLDEASSLSWQIREAAGHPYPQACFAADQLGGTFDPQVLMTASYEAAKLETKLDAARDALTDASAAYDHLRTNLREYRKAWAAISPDRP